MSTGSANAAELDRAALERFLQTRFGAGGNGFACERVAGGQSNPTYFVDFAGHEMVLRKQPSGPILRGAHAIDREYRVLCALAPTDVPVPAPLLYETDRNWLGTPFYLMHRLRGRVFHDCSLPDIAVAERRSIYHGMAEALAKLHTVRPETLNLADFGGTGNYFERQIRRWTKQYRESQAERVPALDELIRWLPANIPDDDGRIAIAHGDFRLGNLLFHPSESRVIGILDWELSTLGHPLADLGFCCLPWHTSPDEYGGILGLDLAGLGIPSQSEFAAHYISHSPPTSRLAPFHIAFALFRFAVIFVGIADRSRVGTATSSEAAKLAPLAARFAERAMEIIEGQRASQP